MKDARYDIFEKYRFTSDGTWFVEGSDVFLDYFHPTSLVPFGIRKNEYAYEGIVGDYRFDEESCSTTEFYINGRHEDENEFDLEELEEIEKEYNEAISKFTKQELDEYAVWFVKNEANKLISKMQNDIQKLNKLLEN